MVIRADPVKLLGAYCTHLGSIVRDRPSIAVPSLTINRRAMDEIVFFRDTVKKLLRHPLQYSEDYMPVDRRASRLGPRKRASLLALKALGRADTKTLAITPSLAIGDVRKEAVAWCGCAPKDTMRLLLKGKALNDDRASVAELAGEDELVINVIVKKYTPANLPDAFWAELEALVGRYDDQSTSEIVSRFRNACK